MTFGFLIGLVVVLTHLGFFTKYKIIAFAGGFSVSFLALKTYYKKEAHYHYPASKKLFYYLILGIPGFQKKLNKFQNIFYKRQNLVSDGIIITGLARAGTTALLQFLAKKPEFKSFTYREMPLLMAAKFWSSINKVKSKKQERIHEDGIKVDLDSPDTFDEYFWRVILKEKYYCDKNQLSTHYLNEDDIHSYETFVSQILSGDETYLTKNNNFILRLHSFLEHKSNFKVLVIFREPIAHAYSLYNQHKNMLEKQFKDPFILDYMDWLGHHEFGLNIKDFNFDDRNFQFKDPDTLNYWLERWINYYEYALSFNDDRIYFVSNRQITNKSENLFLKLINYESQQVKDNKTKNKVFKNSKLNNKLLLKAVDTYCKLSCREV
jgi:hypothetical protein